MPLMNGLEETRILKKLMPTVPDSDATMGKAVLVSDQHTELVSDLRSESPLRLLFVIHEELRSTARPFRREHGHRVRVFDLPSDVWAFGRNRRQGGRKSRLTDIKRIVRYPPY
jgi:hypothetical protein